jgi:hypothetical protein
LSYIHILARIITLGGGRGVTEGSGGAHRKGMLV